MSTIVALSVKPLPGQSINKNAERSKCAWLKLESQMRCEWWLNWWLNCRTEDTTRGVSTPRRISGSSAISCLVRMKWWELIDVLTTLYWRWEGDQGWSNEDGLLWDLYSAISTAILWRSSDRANPERTLANIRKGQVLIFIPESHDWRTVGFHHHLTILPGFNFRCP